MGKRLINLFLLLCCYSLSSFAYQIKSTEVISDGGDYGIDLDWSFTLKSTSRLSRIDDIVIDSEGNVYICGAYHDNVTFPDGTRIVVYDSYCAGFIAKFNNKGEMLWAKNYGGTFTHALSYIYLTDDGYLYVVDRAGETDFKSEPYDFSYTIYDRDTLFAVPSVPYDDMGLTRYRSERNFAVLMKVDAKSGELIDYTEMGGRKVSWYKKDLKVLSDGSLIFHTLVGDDFKGLDEKRLSSSTKLYGDMDAYFVKINSDLTLAWDFAIGGSMKDDPSFPITYYDYFDCYYPYDCAGENSFVVVEDTLILKAFFIRDTIDVDPNPDREVLVMDTLDTYNSAVVAKYYLGNGFPELIDYRYNYTWDLPYSFFKAKNGKVFDFSIKYPTNNLYQYKELSSDYYSSSLIEDSYSKRYENSMYFDRLYDYDRQGNFYITAEDGPIMPIDIQFSEKARVYYERDKDRAALLAKYDTNDQFRWAILWPSATWCGRYATDSKGGVFVGGDNGINEKYWTYISDLDPSPENEVAYSDKDGLGILAKYIETFRIKATPSDSGEIVLPEKLVRYGHSCEVSVTPKAGLKVSKVVTSRGEELKANAEGKYVIENVTDVVTVSAMYEQYSSVADVLSQQINVYPNPATDYVSITSPIGVDRVEIVEMSGRVMCESRETVVSLQGLMAGEYLLRIYTQEGVVLKTIIKK